VVSMVMDHRAADDDVGESYTPRPPRNGTPVKGRCGVGLSTSAFWAPWSCREPIVHPAATIDEGWGDAGCALSRASPATLPEDLHF
jgi:hypothetical protein